MKLLAIDGNSILNRAFYGIKLLSTKDGMYTNAIYGFLNILLKICDEVQPDYIACAFDVKAPTFRHKQFDGYKAGRKGMPEELAMQMPLLKELLGYLGYPMVELAGYEADDILGTLSQICLDTKNECVIATGDRDSLQLVNDYVTVRLATTKMGRPDVTFYDTAAIEEKYGVTPKELIEVKSLMGDSSDNIPGVAGIGEKTALSLIAQYHSIAYIYDHVEELDIKTGVRQKLITDKETAFMSHDLAEIFLEVPIEQELSAYTPKVADKQKAYGLLVKLEMYNMIDKMNLTGTELPATEVQQQATLTYLSAPDKAEILQKLQSMDKIYGLFGYEEDEITAFTLIFEDSFVLYRQENPDFMSILEEILNHSNRLVTNQSKKLYRYGYIYDKNIQYVLFDIELAGYLLSPTSTEYTIERLAGEYGIAMRSANVDLQEDLIADALKLVDLYIKLDGLIHEYTQEKLLEEIEIPLAKVLASMECVGVELDTAGLQEFGEGLDISLAALQSSIYEHAGEEFNINSPKQLSEILFVKLELPTRKKTKSGYSTNADVLETLKGKHPIVDDILEYRKLAKLKSTYVDGLMKVVGEDGRIHTSFQQTETRTGRISSTEPNMQNIPVRTEIGSNLRRFFRAKQGTRFVDADYSQIELRVLAHIANDEAMIAAFLSGEDIHQVTASQVFGLPPLFVTPIMRSRAKAVNFGIVYGIGAFSLSQDIGVSVAEADSYIKGYLNTYSGVKHYMDETIHTAKENGYVSTMFLRRRYLPELASTNKNMQAFGERVAMNMPIQGTAADIIKIAMVRVFERLQTEKLQSQLVLQVHDELIIESPKEENERVCIILKEEMENAVKLSVPLLVDSNVGDTWYDAK